MSVELGKVVSAVRGCAVALCLSGAITTAGAAGGERLPVQFDNWLYHQRNTDNTESWQYRPRFFIPFALSGGWTFVQRIDLPVSYTDAAGPQNTGGGWKAGIGDWLAEETFKSPEVAPNLRLSAGARFVFPTGGSGPFGSGQYQVAPTVGAAYQVPGHQVSINPTARYFMSYHAARDNAARVRRLDLYPNVGVSLGNGWSVSFFDENPIGYNNVTDKWFVPADVLFVKRLEKNVEIAFGGAYGVVRDDPQFHYVLNGRLTLYF